MDYGERESHHMHILYTLFSAQSTPVKPAEGHLQASMGLMYAISQR